MLSIFPLRTSDPARYYIEAVSLGAEEYYLSRGEVPGRWLGRCAEELGLSGTVDADDLRGLLAGRRPDGSDLRDGWVLRPGYDATFSAPKSVSVLYALGAATTSGRWSPPTRRRWQEPSVPGAPRMSRAPRRDSR